VGPLELVASDSGLHAVLWSRADRARVRLPELVTGDHAIIDSTKSQLSEYFDRTRTEFDLPLDPTGTDFQLAVWNALAVIPHGATATYGEQAQAIGRPTAVRAVGAANGKNPLSIVLPCHRVVGAKGTLTGFAGGLDTKRFLLDHERNTESLHLF